MPDPGRNRSRDTIFAPATGSGTSAIAIIRISGDRAHDVLGLLTGRSVPLPRVMSRRWIVDDDDRIDDALVVAFARGASFTGEPMAEVHCHGSRAVVTAIAGRISGTPGCRLAEPGEFARRALEAGRIDLAEAEGMADLIAAETDLQRRQAVRIMSGHLSDRVEAWRTAILRACALVEVSIDWVDEEIPEDVIPEVESILVSLVGELDDELGRARATQRIRTGFEVAIIGAPNVGKSTLLNYLARREAAIVSDVPGTTRDVIEIRYDLKGLPVTFLDTAGLRVVEDGIEAVGIGRAVQRAEAADLRILLRTGQTVADRDGDHLITEGDLRVWSKSDIADRGDGPAISGLSGEGVAELLDMVHARLGAVSSDAGLIAHLRHEEAVSRCRHVLNEAVTDLRFVELEITAERLRIAARHLEGIVGRIDVEAVLDVVFQSFCLGK